MGIHKSKASENKVYLLSIKKKLVEKNLLKDSSKRVTSKYMKLKTIIQILVLLPKKNF